MAVIILERIRRDLFTHPASNGYMDTPSSASTQPRPRERGLPISELS